MYRDILFKAKRKNWRELPKEQWWVEGLLWKKKYSSDRWYISCFPNKDDNEEIRLIDSATICQYTGLNDKNGNKVWENDIVKYWSYHDGDDYAQIKFGTYQSCFDKMVSKHHGFYVNWESNRRKDLGYWLDWTDYAEIVSNIFDNPELLNGNR